MDKLTTVMGCTSGALINTLSILLCSSSTKTFHSAVHFPTEMVVSQLKHEMGLGSVSNPVVLDHITQAISSLESVVNSDLLQSKSQGGSTPSIEQVMSMMNELVGNFDENDKKQRGIVERVFSEGGEVPQDGVLERPPLASQVRRRRGVPADDLLNDFQSPECGLAKLATTLCSPVHLTKALENLAASFATSLTNLELARHTLLSEIVQSQGCSSEGVTGKLLAWASLASSERSLLGIFTAVLNAKKTAEEQQENGNRDESFQKLDKGMGELLSDFPSLFGSSMGQLSDAAGGMGSSMGEFVKPVGNQGKRMFGIFG